MSTVFTCNFQPTLSFPTPLMRPLLSLKILTSQIIFITHTSGILSVFKGF